MVFKSVEEVTPSVDVLRIEMKFNSDTATMLTPQFPASVWRVAGVDLQTCLDIV